jgi:uncharacterized membrane protein
MSPTPEFSRVDEILSKLNSNNQNQILQELKDFFYDCYFTFDIVTLLLSSKLCSKNISNLFNDISFAPAVDLFSVHNYMEIFTNIIFNIREIDENTQLLFNTVEFVFKPDEYKKTNFKQTIYYENKPNN